jgi:hypothetical protein
MTLLVLGFFWLGVIHVNLLEQVAVLEASNTKDPDQFTGLHWVWQKSCPIQQLHNNDSSWVKKTRPSILIAQASGPGSYLHLLDATQKVNRAYACKYSYDYVALIGMPVVSKDAWSASHLKIRILHEVLSRFPEYDALLYMDADAFLTDFDYDIVQLLDHRYALTAQCAGTGNHTWNLNDGVTFWNMRHRDTSFIAKWWYFVSTNSLRYTPYEKFPILRKAIADQFLLHVILLLCYRKGQRELALYTPNFIFEYHNGTVVKHVIRANYKIWGDVVDERSVLVKNLTKSLCLKNKQYCKSIPDQIERPG